MVSPGQRWLWKAYEQDKWLIVEVLEVDGLVTAKVVQIHNSTRSVGDVDTRWSIDKNGGTCQVDRYNRDSWTLLEGQDAPQNT